MIAIIRSSLNLKTKEITREIIEYWDDGIDYKPLLPILFKTMKDYFGKHPGETKSA